MTKSKWNQKIDELEIVAMNYTRERLRAIIKSDQSKRKIVDEFFSNRNQCLSTGIGRNRLLFTLYLADEPPRNGMILSQTGVGIKSNEVEYFDAFIPLKPAWQLSDIEKDG